MTAGPGQRGAPCARAARPVVSCPTPVGWNADRVTPRASPGAERWHRRRLLRALAVPFVLAGGEWPLSALSQAAADAPRSRTLRVNGVTLHYLEWGDERRPPLVLLHPAPLNAHVWDRFGAAMAANFHVVAPEARGFGDSGWSERYDDDLFLDDLDALLKALRLERPILVGNSMGGTLAYSYAGMHPDRVERLILVDTGPGEPPSNRGSGGAAPPAGPPPLPLGPFGSSEDAAARVPLIMGAAFGRAMVQHNLKRTPDGQWMWKFDPNVLAAGARSMVDPRKWPRWRAVRCPTLVLRGERSPAWSQQAAERVVAANSNASLVTIPGAGHFVPIEAPDAFEAAVRRWLHL